MTFGNPFVLVPVWVPPYQVIQVLSKSLLGSAKGQFHYTKKVSWDTFSSVHCRTLFGPNASHVGTHRVW